MTYLPICQHKTTLPLTTGDTSKTRCPACGALFHRIAATFHEPKVKYGH